VLDHASGAKSGAATATRGCAHQPLRTLMWGSRSPHPCHAEPTAKHLLLGGDTTIRVLARSATDGGDPRTRDASSPSAPQHDILAGTPGCGATSTPRPHPPPHRSLPLEGGGWDGVADTPTDGACRSIAKRSRRRAASRSRPREDHASDSRVEPRRELRSRVVVRVGKRGPIDMRVRQVGAAEAGALKRRAVQSRVSKVRVA
jgi:hypothetical protein